MALVDGLGNLVRFVVQPGQRNDIVGVRPLIEGICFDALLADKAFDANWLREELNNRGATAVIPPRSNRKIQFEYDKEMYKWRHLVENYFATHKTPAIRAWLAKRPHWHVHFTPTGSSWLNMVERFFAEITQRQIRRGVHRSERELTQAILSYIEIRNEDPNPSLGFEPPMKFWMQ